MSNIQENVNIGSETDNILSVIVETISELDWIMQEKEPNRVVFREKRRFDHFNHVEGIISIEYDPRNTILQIDIWNSGMGSIQEEYLRGKLSELILNLKYNIDEMKKDLELEGHSRMRNIADEMESLSRLHREGDLSDMEFKIAKTKLLEERNLQ